VLHGWKNGKTATMTFSERDLVVLVYGVGSPIADFFCENFFMNSLTDELLGIKADKFAVGDLVKTKSATDAYNMPLLGIVTSITMLKKRQGHGTQLLHR
jgi:hypothetical protein